MLQSLINGALARAVAHAVGDSTRAAELLQQLDGRRLDVAATGSPWVLQLRGTDGGLRARFGSDAAEAADATVTGSIPALLGALGGGQRAVLGRGALQVQGDALLLERFVELLHLLRPDLEQLLARVAGPVPAHLLARGIAGVRDGTGTLLRTQAHALAEWLAYERRTLVPRPEAEHRYRDIEALREAVDRAEARLRALEGQP